jgi:hypothetical protein
MKVWANNTGVKLTRDDLLKIEEATDLLAQIDVLVGFPEDTSGRKKEELADMEITNAALGYLHDQGVPESGIPQREFMAPAIKEIEPEVEKALSGMLKAALKGNTLRLEQATHALGMKVKVAIQKKINEGIPPPLSDYTVRQRMEKGRKGAIKEMDRRRIGLAPSLFYAKPLIDTAQMRNAVNYVIRQRSQRKR